MSENENAKFCPLLAIMSAQADRRVAEGSHDLPPCHENKCGWWCYERGMCALKALALVACDMDKRAREVRR